MFHGADIIDRRMESTGVIEADLIENFQPGPNLQFPKPVPSICYSQFRSGRVRNAFHAQNLIAKLSFLKEALKLGRRPSAEL